jgi:hypothetical protein
MLLVRVIYFNQGKEEKFMETLSKIMKKSPEIAEVILATLFVMYFIFY